MGQLDKNGFGTFWSGAPLTALDRACVRSFIDAGHDVTLYSYEPIGNLPDGLHTSDAGAILDQSQIEHVRYGGKPDLAHFSDLFRYEMIRKTGKTWIDMDLVKLGNVPLPVYDNILVKEVHGPLNGAILSITDEELLSFVQREATTKLDRDLKWGETGPSLLRNCVKRSPRAIDVYDSQYFYPLHHDDIWRVLLPSQYDYCVEQCSRAATLHLFNNILCRMGYWKEIGPPEGSYLHTVFDKAGVLDEFAQFYPEKVMLAVVENFCMRQNGKDLGIGSIIRETLPSMRRSYRHWRA